MADGARKKKRWITDLVATYGLGILDWPGMPGRSYELAFVLALDAERVNTRHSFIVLDGVRGALEPVTGMHFWKAMLDRDDEAEFYHGLNADRVKFHTRRAKQSRAMQDQLGEAAE